jgi:mono/diheme cytochrome c family protein
MKVRSGALLAPFILAPALLLYAAASAQNPTHLKAKRKAVARSAAAKAPDRFAHDVVPLIKTYCAGCHGVANPPAGITLTGNERADSVLKARGLWEQVAENVGSGHMPPDGAPRPTDAQRAQLTSYVNSTLTVADCQLHDPGHVTMRRLNRAEYNNTVRDLLGVTLRPADDFPSDDSGYGFDNIGDVLSISPLLMERYLNAAVKVAEAAIITPEQARKPIRFRTDQMPGAKPQTFSTLTGHFFGTEGEIGIDYDFPHAGDYTLRARAFGQQAGPEPARMGFRFDGNQFSTVEVRAVEATPQVYEASVTVPTPGKHHIAVAFLNDYYVPAKDGKPAEDRNLIAEYLEVEPTTATQLPPTPAQRRIFFVQPTPTTIDACARKILARLALHAYRRPVADEEITRLLRYVHLAQREGQSFERGIQYALEAMLVSPNFLYHVELSAHPNDTHSREPLDSYAMASRLSYFLWASMPDDTLLTLAAKNRLQDPKVLAGQVQRMLADPKAQALADNFAAQWLQLRNLEVVRPDPVRFPECTADVRRDMRTETEMFFEEIVKEDRSVLDFLDGKFTFLNARLAQYYGIPGVQGDQFRRVDLDGVQRGGVLTQASILTVTSNPTRTSPVKRGKWVLEQFLGTPPPPPPPGVGVLPDEKSNAVLTGTLRQRMEEHRKKPICASCHARMDPIGFGLENYNAVGKWRTTDGNLPIDSSGVLPDGQSFNGPAQLKTILRAKSRLFVRCLATKLMTYALGRGIEHTDRCNLDGIVESVTKHEDRFSALVTAIVLSDPFRVERGDGGEKNG